MPGAEHYNARAQTRPIWTDINHNATYRRLAEGRGVFVAGGKQGVRSEAHERPRASTGSTRGPVVKVLLAQCGLTAAAAALFWGFDGSVSAYSALLGGLTAVIPNSFLALRLALPRRDPGASGLLRAAYIGELGKLALTVLMFGMTFALVRPLAAGALFAGFIVAQLATFAGLLMRDNGQVVRTGNRNGD